MSEAFIRIVNMSITASWLVLAVIAVRFLFKKTPKWILCLLWALVAIRLICPVSIESSLSLIPSTRPLGQEIIFVAETEKPANGEILDAEGTILYEQSAPAANGEILDAEGNVIYKQNLERYHDRTQEQMLLNVLSGIWLAGVGLMFLYTLASYCLLRHKVATAIAIRKGIYQCDYVDSPFVLGLIRPVIYLPFGMADQDIAYVIAHEQAHIRRFDHWWKPLGFLLLTIHWFNPIMWVAYILLCRDIELACDEKVIEKLGNEQRADYTQALVACSIKRRSIAACPLAFGEVGVKERVKSVMNYKKPAFWMVIMTVVVCVVVAVCFLTNPIDNTNNESFLNYKNAISMSQRQDVIPAVHYSSENDKGSIGIGMVEGIAFGEYLDNAQWNEKWFSPSDLSSPGSVAVNVAENLRITIYDRNFAAVEFNDEVCYYRIANDDYERLLDMLMPADEERLENSAESRLNLALGIATMDPNIDGISSEGYDMEEANNAVDSDGWLFAPTEHIVGPTIDEITDQLHELQKLEAEQESSAESTHHNPPSLTITYREESIEEPRIGLVNWEYTKEDGTKETVMGDGAHPLDAKHSSPFLTLDPYVDEPFEIWLHWDLMPDSVLVRYWGEESWGELETEPAGRILVKEKNKTGDAYCFEPKEGNCIYEILATWDSAPDYSGKVYYNFHAVMTDRVPSNQEIYEKYISNSAKGKYYYVDVNEDGKQELFISRNNGESELVTVSDGEVVRILHENHLFLCEGGIIGRKSEGSGGQTLIYYKLENQEPVIVDVITNLNDDTWYHTSEVTDIRYVSYKTMNRITEEEAHRICAQYALAEENMPWNLTNFYPE